MPDPVPARGEVLIRVRATAINHADLLQVRGLYPPPPGAPEVPGLECSGEVEATGEGVAGWAPGERVMALLAGGGHGELVAAPEGQVMPLPERLSFAEGAAIPEVGLTAWTNLVAEGGLRAGEWVLLVGAASGVGTFAVQLARALGARVVAAGRSRERLLGVEELGAEGSVLLGEELPETVRRLTGGRGAELVLDLVGGGGFRRHLAAMADRGRLVLVGLVGGAWAEVDLSEVLRRRLRVVGSVLRSRSVAEKTELVSAFRDFALPLLTDGTLRPLVDRTFSFEELPRAYAALQAGGVLGKVVVER